MKHRVYVFHVGCLVYDIEAPDGASAVSGVLEQKGTFLHDANEPLENLFFAEAYTYNTDGTTPDEPIYVHPKENSHYWLTCPLP